MPVDPEKARLGILKFIDKKGGSVAMADLHAHSKLFYQAAHRDFSELMEGLVGDDLVVYDEPNFQLTDKGKASVSSESSPS